MALLIILVTEELLSFLPNKAFTTTDQAIRIFGRTI